MCAYVCICEISCVGIILLVYVGPLIRLVHFDDILGHQQEAPCHIIGARRGGRGSSHPEPEKIVVEKWCYFPELYKMTGVQEDAIENG